MSAVKQKPKATQRGVAGKQAPLDVVAACKDVMARFPKILARLAE
jgi:hypothetical protein